MSSKDQPTPAHWDERYAQPGWAFGTEPNDFLREQAMRLPAGSRVLALAEGEGRNAVFLAGLGARVHAVDLSRVGLAKAQELARARGVAITTEVADLAEYAIAPGAYDAIVSIFAHLPSEARERLHARIVPALPAGGLLLLEGYTPTQHRAGTGGPETASKFFTLEQLQREFSGLDWLVAHELEREVLEGRYHTGRAHVVQLVGVKPSAQ